MTSSVATAAGSGLVIVEDEESFRSDADVAGNIRVKAHSGSAGTIFDC